MTMPVLSRIYAFITYWGPPCLQPLLPSITAPFQRSAHAHWAHQLSSAPALYDWILSAFDNCAVSIEFIGVPRPLCLYLCPCRLSTLCVGRRPVFEVHMGTHAQCIGRFPCVYRTWPGLFTHATVASCKPQIYRLTEGLPG